MKMNQAQLDLSNAQLTDLQSEPSAVAQQVRSAFKSKIGIIINDMGVKNGELIRSMKNHPESTTDNSVWLVTAEAVSIHTRQIQ